MKLVFEKLIDSPDEGFAVKVMRSTSFHCPWHFHPECELSLVLQSGGYRIVGDNITPLEPGDLVLVGANLPHIYQNDEHVPGPKPPVHCVVVQFEERFLGPALLDLPALLPVRRLLRRAALGIEVTGRTRARASALMLRMVKLRGLRRIAAFLEILDLLSRSRQCRTIASPGFEPQWTPGDADDPLRLSQVCQFINERLEQPIRLREAARLAHLSEGAFSRFFRRHLRRTFPAFVNELRIGRACRLLAESDRPVIEIAAACGYANLSNFNRQFLRLKNTTPRRFRERVQAIHRLGRS
jgi:AraC-like DNA-binding protein